MAVKIAPTTSAAREAQQLFFQIGMVQRTRIGAALTELGLTFAQAHALRLLDPDRPSPMSALAELLVCDASNVTGIADRLEARGLDRAPQPSAPTAASRRSRSHRPASSCARASPT